MSAQESGCLINEQVNIFHPSISNKQSPQPFILIIQYSCNICGHISVLDAILDTNRFL